MASPTLGQLGRNGKAKQTETKQVGVHRCFHPQRIFQQRFPPPPSKSRALVSHGPAALLNISPIHFQNQMLGGSSSWCMSPGLWSPVWGSDPCSSCKVLISLTFVFCCAGIWVLTNPHLCPSYLSRCVFFFVFLVVYDLIGQFLIRYQR